MIKRGIVQMFGNEFGVRLAFRYHNENTRSFKGIEHTVRKFFIAVFEKWFL